MRQMDFGVVRDDGSVLVVFADADLRTAHMVARRLASVMRHTGYGAGDSRNEPVVTVVSMQEQDSAKSAAGSAGCAEPSRRVLSRYAALRSSARLASWRRISVVPVSRSSEVSHSWKNTTFMSGRTRAA